MRHSIIHHTYTETKMTNIFFALFVKMLSIKSKAHRSDLMTLAKIEYGKDWQWAYEYLLNSNGKLPSSGVKI
jgi:hypothetical protein